MAPFVWILPELYNTSVCLVHGSLFSARVIVLLVHLGVVVILSNTAKEQLQL